MPMTIAKRQKVETRPVRNPALANSDGFMKGSARAADSRDEKDREYGEEREEDECADIEVDDQGADEEGCQAGAEYVHAAAPAVLARQESADER